MENWQSFLKVDPIPALLASQVEPVVYFTRRDLLDDHQTPVDTLWRLKTVERILAHQQAGGSWKYPGGRSPQRRVLEDYEQLETYRMLCYLVEKFGLDRRHPAIRRAAEFLFERQTPEGDFRGIYGGQYTPNYSGAILELLIKAKFTEDARIERGMQWLLSIRQADEGWAIPLRTVGLKFDQETLGGALVYPDISRPSSHLVTGIVLRAFAAHPAYRASGDARMAGSLLANRFFKADKYPDRREESYWTSFSYPYWFTDLISSLDLLSYLGFTVEDAQIEMGLNWLIERQQEDGLWYLNMLRDRDKDLHLWLSLAICRLLRRFA